MGWRDTLGDAWDGATDVVDGVRDGVTDAGEWVADTAGDVRDDIVDAGEWALDTADDAGDWVLDTAGDLRDGAAAVAGVVVSVASDLAQGATRAAAREVQGLLSDLQSLGWGNPIVILQRVRDTAQAAWDTTHEPPGPDPARLREAADGWLAMRSTFEQAADDTRTTAGGWTGAVWQGPAGSSARSSVRALAARLDSVPPACRSVAVALDACADEVESARQTWQTAREDLPSLRRLVVPDIADPDDLLDLPVAGPHSRAVQALSALFGAYDRADAAMETCARDVATALDDIRLPDRLSPGAGAIAQVSATTTTVDVAGDPDVRSDDEGPLRGSVVERASSALEQMSPAERVEAERLLDGAGSSEREAWLLAAIASGLTGAPLAEFARSLGRMPDGALATLDPSTSPGDFRQPDQTTCGSSTLVMSRMLNDPAYMMYILTGDDPRGSDGHYGADAGSPEQRFAEEALAMHDRTNTLWPEAVGTFPSSATDQMGDGSGVPGTSYTTRVVDPGDAGETYDLVVRAVDAGHTVPMYSYGIADGGSWESTGAHVTLAVGTEDGNVTVYNPADGSYRTLTPQQWADGDTKDPLSWTTPMTVTLPQGS